MLHLESNADKPLYQQIYEQLKDDILSGVLREGARLVATRVLARDLKTSRNTVENAYAQLALEGYVEAIQGAGHVVRAVSNDIHPAYISPALKLGKRPVHTEAAPCRYDFYYGNLEPETFPHKVWSKLSADALEAAGKGYPRLPGMHAYGDVRGDRQLREELAQYLYQSRGVVCTSDQIVVCSGLQSSLASILQMLPPRYRAVAIEDPGYARARIVFKQHGCAISPIPVNSGGIDLRALEASSARMVLLTPSHQFPTGAIMPIQKRMDILRWAAEVDGIIIEDDYDSEFRYNGRPVPSLQSIDRLERTIYTGTFSKALSPGLRIGFMVLPDRLLHEFNDAFAGYRCAVSLLEQKTLARFMAEGYWEKHLRKTSTLGKKKHDTLIEAITRFMGEKVRVLGHNAGLHILLEFLSGEKEEDLIIKAAEHGVRVYPASVFRMTEQGTHASLLLGYGLLRLEDIPAGVRLMAKAWFGAPGEAH